MSEKIKQLLKIQDIDIQLIQLKEAEIQYKKTKTEIGSKLDKIKDDLNVKTKKHALLEAALKEHMNKLETCLERIKKIEKELSVASDIKIIKALSAEQPLIKREKDQLDDTLTKLEKEFDTEQGEIDRLTQSYQEKMALYSEQNKESQNYLGRIYDEVKVLNEERKALAADVDPEFYSKYLQLLRSKKERVVCPIQDHACSGCNITVTEDRIIRVKNDTSPVFCDYCGVIQCLIDDTSPENEDGEEEGKKRRRRRVRTA